MRTMPIEEGREDQLLGLRIGIERAARLTRAGRLSATDLRAAVEADLASLGALAGSGPKAKPPEPAHQATLDAVASHLLAAVDASLSGVRNEVVADLLGRAADRLNEPAA